MILRDKAQNFNKCQASLNEGIEVEPYINIKNQNDRRMQSPNIFQNQ